MAPDRPKRKNSLGDDEDAVAKKSRVDINYIENMANDTGLQGILQSPSGDTIAGSVPSEEFLRTVQKYYKPQPGAKVSFVIRQGSRIRVPKAGDTRGTVFDMKQIEEEEEREFGETSEPVAGSSSNAPSSSQSQQASAGTSERAREPSPSLNPRVVEVNDSDEETVAYSTRSSPIPSFAARARSPSGDDISMNRGSSSSSSSIPTFPRSAHASGRSNRLMSSMYAPTGMSASRWAPNENPFTQGHQGHQAPQFPQGYSDLRYNASDYPQDDTNLSNRFNDVSRSSQRGGYRGGRGGVRRQARDHPYYAGMMGRHATRFPRPATSSNQEASTPPPPPPPPPPTTSQPARAAAVSAKDLSSARTDRKRQHAEAVRQAVTEGLRSEPPFYAKVHFSVEDYERMRANGDEAIQRTGVHIQCCNCGHLGHRNLDCAFPNVMGAVVGCFVCNVTDHSIWTCLTEVARSILADPNALWDLIGARRANMPPGPGEWVQLVPDIQNGTITPKTAGFPWTRRFTKRMRDGKHRVNEGTANEADLRAWETCDYRSRNGESVGSRFPVDPATSSLAIIMANFDNLTLSERWMKTSTGKMDVDMTNVEGTEAAKEATPAQAMDVDKESPAVEDDTFVPIGVVPREDPVGAGAGLDKQPEAGATVEDDVFVPPANARSDNVEMEDIVHIALHVNSTEAVETAEEDTMVPPAGVLSESPEAVETVEEDTMVPPAGVLSESPEAVETVEEDTMVPPGDVLSKSPEAVETVEEDTMVPPGDVLSKSPEADETVEEDTMVPPGDVLSKSPETDETVEEDTFVPVQASVGGLDKEKETGVEQQDRAQAVEETDDDITFLGSLSRLFLEEDDQDDPAEEVEVKEEEIEEEGVQAPEVEEDDFVPDFRSDNKSGAESDSESSDSQSDAGSDADDSEEEGAFSDSDSERGVEATEVLTEGGDEVHLAY
ncbi:hypothetical protein K4K54_010536 [Colletotrichum sp. SAR 10_86]|nr:hypothetical protein KHU50_010095 [Colletotrichum sp. SAR 10_65]KAI8218360.1 hypothetical protein K4K54_010536 [Colletotrichum sp. SAR 10_86]